MVRLILYSLVVIVSGVFYACGPSQRELAVAKIEQGKSLLVVGDTLAAILCLDSVKILYPKAEVQISVAASINEDLYRFLIDTRMEQLRKVEEQIIDLEQNFIQEKTEYDRYKQYIPKRQQFARSWNRSYLQVNLDERGELFIASHYMGKEWLNHTSIRVYDQGLQAHSETVSLDDLNNRQSDFLDYKWEKVSYRGGKSDSIIHFINNNRELKLKCVFLGNRHYYILLEEFDIQSVIDALALSNAIKKRKELQDEIAYYRKK